MFQKVGMDYIHVFSDHLCLHPFPLNWIQIRAVWWQEQNIMSMRSDCTQCVSSFMKSGIIHHRDRAFRKWMNQLVISPCMKNISVDIAFKQTDVYCFKMMNSPNRIHPSPAAPVPAAITPLSSETVAALHWGIHTKPALIHINNRTVFYLLILMQICCKFSSFCGVCLWMKQCFFYCWYPNDAGHTEYSLNLSQNVLHVRADNCQGNLLHAFVKLPCRFWWLVCCDEAWTPYGSPI